MFDYNPDAGVIRAYGPIGPYEDGIDETDFMQAFDVFAGDDIIIQLQSEGGSVTSGLSIYNQIAAYSGRVSVHVDALAASIASVFPMAADEVVANSNSMLMVHDPWAMAMGNATAFRGVADVLDKLADDIAGTYADKTGKSHAHWRDVMAREVYFNASEALSEGLVDRIADTTAKRESKPQRAAAAMVSPAFATKQIAAKLRLRSIRG